MIKDYKKTVQIFKALADETRLEIVDMLAGGELCACKILENFHITQPTLSYHMKLLTDCGLVIGRRDGAWMRYSLNQDTFESMKGMCCDFCVNLSVQKNADQCKAC
jgi:ArsR family transcriptional regulator